MSEPAVDVEGKIPSNSYGHSDRNMDIVDMIVWENRNWVSLKKVPKFITLILLLGQFLVIESIQKPEKFIQSDIVLSQRSGYNEFKRLKAND